MVLICASKTVAREREREREGEGGRERERDLNSPLSVLFICTTCKDFAFFF
jgi:hypothetical protein